MSLRDHSEQSEAAALLYGNSFNGIIVSAITSTVLTFGFQSNEVQHIKYGWWILFIFILLLRLADQLYWKRQISKKSYDSHTAEFRFVSGVIVTALLWTSYVFIIVDDAHIIELASSIIIISAMAGGSATILAGSKIAAMCYSGILLLPTSLNLLIHSDTSANILGGLGFMFGIVMVISGKKAAEFTANAIKLKNHNRILVTEMEGEVRKRTVQIHKLSNLDPLTKLFNRNAFTQTIGPVIQNAKNLNTTVAVLFVDLDGFKQINDALGHQIGDTVLQQITQRILDLEFECIVGRWGGDEFVLAVPDSNERHAIECAETVIKNIRESLHIDSFKLNVGASIGISLCPEHSIIESELIQFADIAMYQQKNSGEKAPLIFTKELYQNLKNEETLREGLRDAIANNELYMVYQPIIDSHTHTVQSCEALLRWQFRGELIPPLKFIGICEQSGLIIDIGKWVLRKACEDVVSWGEDFKGKISVNVSMVQLLDHSFLECLDETLQSTGLSGERLVLEITESTFVDNQEFIKELLFKIKERSVNISIDDFGTGYSSMSQLQSLPFDVVKIDRSFVNNIYGNGEAIIKATIFIANELKCQTVAEGIETSEQAHALEELGATYLQGFLYAKPMPSNELTLFINKNKD